MPAINVRVDQELWSDLRAQKPHFLSDTAYLNLVISQAIGGTSRLDGATEPASGQHSLGRSPSKAVSSNRRNKENDFSLQAEEAHVSVKAVKTIKAKPTFDIAQNLWGHEDLIRAYWKAKPKNKTGPAWKLLMTELTKIQDGHGDAAVRAQLELGEANRWQGITLANYERFGLPKGNTPAQSGGVDWAEVDRLTFGGAA